MGHFKLYTYFPFCLPRDIYGKRKTSNFFSCFVGNVTTKSEIYQKNFKNPVLLTFPQSLMCFENPRRSIEVELYYLLCTTLFIIGPHEFLIALTRFALCSPNKVFVDPSCCAHLLSHRNEHLIAVRTQQGWSHEAAIKRPVHDKEVILALLQISKEKTRQWNDPLCSMWKPFVLFCHAIKEGKTNNQVITASYVLTKIIAIKILQYFCWYIQLNNPVCDE